MNKRVEQITEILERELRLVEKEEGVWCVEPGNIEHCAKLIAEAISDGTQGECLRPHEE